MVVKTEGQHQGEYLVSEGNGAISREAGTVASGQVIKDGDVLGGSPTALAKLVATTEAIVADDIVGIAYGDWDATAGAITGVPYIARLAEVKLSLIRATGADAAELKAALAAHNIITRAS